MTAALVWILAVAFGCVIGAVVLVAVFVATSYDRNWP
jgi:hypothetical protein